MRDYFLIERERAEEAVESLDTILRRPRMGNLKQIRMAHDYLQRIVSKNLGASVIVWAHEAEEMVKYLLRGAASLLSRKERRCCHAVFAMIHELFLPDAVWKDSLDLL